MPATYVRVGFYTSAIVSTSTRLRGKFRNCGTHALKVCETFTLAAATSHWSGLLVTRYKNVRYSFQEIKTSICFGGMKSYVAFEVVSKCWNLRVTARIIQIVVLCCGSSYFRNHLI